MKVDSHQNWFSNENSNERDIYNSNNEKIKWYNDSDMIEVNRIESENKEMIHSKNGFFSNLDFKNERERKLEFSIDSLRKNRLESTQGSEDS